MACKMKTLLSTVPEALEVLMKENPEVRFAIDAEHKTVWAFQPGTNQWQVRVTTFPTGNPSEAMRTGVRGPEISCFVEVGDTSFTMNAEGDWGWNRVFKPNCTIYEPHQSHNRNVPALAH